LRYRCGRSRTRPCGLRPGPPVSLAGTEALVPVPESLSAVRGGVSSNYRTLRERLRLFACIGVLLQGTVLALPSDAVSSFSRSVRSLVESCAWELLLHSENGNSYLHLSAALLSGVSHWWRGSWRHGREYIVGSHVDVSRYLIRREGRQLPGWCRMSRGVVT
jgi:hypothetical protein